MVLKLAADPVLAAWQKNRALRGSGHWARSPSSPGVKGALFSGRVRRCGDVVAAAAPEHHMHYRMLVEDESGRELLFEVPLVPEYHQIRRGMSVEVVVLSDDTDFARLSAVTEAYVPACGVFVGQYPYLDRRVFLRRFDRLERRRRLLPRQAWPEEDEKEDDAVFADGDGDGGRREERRGVGGGRSAADASGNCAVPARLAGSGGAGGGGSGVSRSAKTAGGGAVLAMAGERGGDDDDGSGGIGGGGSRGSGGGRTRSGTAPPASFSSSTSGAVRRRGERPSSRRETRAASRCADSFGDAY
ncbi:unnamed protein product [Phaeothamnion confervicola]